MVQTTSLTVTCGIMVPYRCAVKTILLFRKIETDRAIYWEVKDRLCSERISFQGINGDG
jgi:hypothetical protein